MEVAGCILLLPQLFLQFLYTYTDLLYLLSLNQSFSCFLQLVLSILSLTGFVYVFHLLHVPLPSSKHLPQVISKHNHSPLPVYLLLLSIPTCPSASLYSFCPPTLHCTLLSPKIFLLF